MSDQDEIFRVQESVVPQLLAQPGVTGVAVGFREKDGKLTDEIVIRVYVQDKRPLAEVPAELRIPSEIGGFKTDVIQKGPDVPSVLENIKRRPLVNGLEISRALWSGGPATGTLACFVSDKLPDNIRSQLGQPGLSRAQHVYLLSASHVLKPAVNTVDGVVHQPRPSLYINSVAQILGDRCVLSGGVDAGLARLDADVEWKNDVHEVGTIDGIRRVRLGETVWKQGKTTGLTSRKVQALNYFADVYMGIRAFGPQMQIGPHNPGRDPFQSEGDSGSLVWVWDDDPQGGKLLRAVGLAIAYNNVSATACHLDTVFETLKIEFPLTKAGKGTNLYSSGLSPYHAYSYHGIMAGIPAREREQVLQAHNTERRIYPGVGSLQWSPELAQRAQELAQRLAETGYDLMNPPRPGDDPLRPGEPVGQNIFWAQGPRVATGADAVQAWLSEKQWYNYDRDDGKSMESQNSNNFRQVIWKATQFVGCGKAYRTYGDGATYIVCNYSPAGNWFGQKPY
jgi:hypothetical protein